LVGTRDNVDRSSVGSAELERIARAHRDSESLVRQLVDDRLLEPAFCLRDSLGRLVWVYPVANIRRLRLVLTLRALGYRGDAVHFLLWWFQLHPFPGLVLGESADRQAPGFGAVPRFVEHTIRDCITGVEEAIKARVSGPAGGKLDGAKVRRLLQKVPVTVVIEMLRARAVASGQKLDDNFLTTLQTVGYPFVLWMLGVRPSDIGYDPVSKINSVQSAIRQSGLNGAKQFAQLIPDALSALDQPGAIDQVYRLIRSADAAVWEQSRARVRADPEALHLRKMFTVSIARLIRAKDIGFPERLFRRHASFRHVTATILAAQFAVPIVLEHFIPGTLNQSERKDKALDVA
jgi:hypothetical protein